MENHLFEFAGEPVTLWTLAGYLGILMFGGRWLVQMLASRHAGRPVLPPLFWYMSMTGNVLLLVYFAFGIRDAVGTLSNVFPAFVALYNLSLDARHRRQDPPLIAPSGR